MLVAAKLKPSWTPRTAMNASGTPSDPTDSELATALKSADRRQRSAALERVVERYGALVTAIGFGVTGDAAGADDVAQTVFLKVLRNAGMLSDPSKLRSWLSHIARSSAIDWRRRRKHLRISLEELEEQGVSMPAAETAAEDDPAHHLISIETRRMILEAITGLPAKYREIITLKHLADMSYQEISETLSLTVSAVESRLYRARNLLRERLERLGVFSDERTPP